MLALIRFSEKFYLVNSKHFFYSVYMPRPGYRYKPRTPSVNVISQLKTPYEVL